jgi:hypothetical protein
MIFATAVFLCFSCSSVQYGASEKIPIPNTASPTPAVEPTPKSIADINFEKEWKSKYEKTRAVIERNRVLWQESKITNYDFVAAKYAGGTTNTWNRSPVVIKVRNREKSSLELESTPTGSYMERTDGFEEIDTIDKLFDYLRQELEKGKMLEVEYDKKFGNPKTVFIRDSYEIHGSRTIKISRFTVVK